MIGLMNLAVFPGRCAAASPEPITAGNAGKGATSSQATMFMDSGLGASRHPGMTR